MRFSVVIATYNRKESLRRCLTAVTNQNHPDYEVIVVDDNSNDGTQAMIAEEFPHITFFHLSANHGPAFARNRGTEAAGGDIVAYTDDDCLVPPDWLSQLDEGFRQYPQIAGVGGYQEAPLELIQSNVVARADHIMRLRRWGQGAHRQDLGGYEVSGLATNNVAYRRTVLMECQGFDETFPVAAGEDADLKLRISQLGYSLLYIPLKVEHWRDYSLKAQWRMAIRRGVGVYYFEAKHSQPPGIGRITLRLTKRTLHFFVSLFSVRWDVALVMYLTAVADALGQLQTHSRRK